MNIFVLSECPVESARSLADVHVNKMIIESAQMLANAYPLGELEFAPKTQSGNYRKHSYLHHPCSKWVLESLDNWEWLLLHAKALIDEKYYRTGKLHFTSHFIDWCANNKPTLSKLELTPFVKCVPEDLKCFNVTNAYRFYYWDKRLVMKTTWTKREPPEWWIEFMAMEQLVEMSEAMGLYDD